jgi:AcrR family transcriptional regulator
MVKVSRARAAALRDEIFVATATELGRNGFDALALTTVAARCGLATSAIYNRFSTKAALVSALVDEHLEPVLGPALDARAGAMWQREPAAVALDRDGRAALHEVQLAARHVPALRDAVARFLTRRVDAALALRDVAEQAGLVRGGQDPRAQVLLDAGADAGAYLLALAGDPPSAGLDTVEHVVRVALTKEPWASPAPAARAARRRRDPGRATPEGHALDALGEALVLAAADAFAERGYDGATVGDIARRAGVTTGAIYNRFRGKAGLLVEVVSQISAPRASSDMDVVVGAVTGASAPAAGRAIAAVLDRTGAPELARDRALRLESRHAARREPEVAEVVQPLQDHALATVAAAFRTARDEGSIRADVDPEALAWWVTAVPLGLWLLDDATVRPVDWAPTFAAVVRALRTAPRA